MTPAWCPPPDPAGTLPTDAAIGQMASSTVSELCARGMQGEMAIGIVLETLRRTFSQPAVVGEKTVRNKLWKPDLPDGKPHPDGRILIETIYRWVDQVGRRPALVVKPQGEKYFNLGIDDAAGHDERAQAVFGNRWVGSATVFAIAGTGDEAQFLSTEAKNALNDFGPVIRSKLGLRAFFVAGRDAPMEIEESKEAWAVPINLGWAYDYGWKVLQESPILREVRFTPAVLLGWTE